MFVFDVKKKKKKTVMYDWETKNEDGGLFIFKYW